MSQARCRRWQRSLDKSTAGPSTDAFASQLSRSQAADRSAGQRRATADHHSGTSTLWHNSSLAIEVAVADNDFDQPSRTGAELRSAHQ